MASACAAGVARHRQAVAPGGNNGSPSTPLLAREAVAHWTPPVAREIGGRQLRSGCLLRVRLSGLTHKFNVFESPIFGTFGFVVRSSTLDVVPVPKKRDVPKFRKERR